MSLRLTRSAMFLAACIAAVAAVLLYITVTRSDVGAPPRTGAPAIKTMLIDAMPSGPIVAFRHAGPGPLFGRLAIVTLPLGDTTGPRAIAPLSCERLHYAAGWGVCMVQDETRLPIRYEAFVFDHTFQRRHTVPLTGPPIRARVSPDGRRAALTVFETGHSYADESFSTRTIIIDTASGALLTNLEEFAVRKDGAPFKELDFNFWGVTFAPDGNRFFATLKTHGARYLVRGSVDARTAEVVRASVECPSLSPDERLIVFKKPMSSEVGWRLYVLDLTTGAERPLNQLHRSVDDQVDWFDSTHIVYHDSAPQGTGIWMLAVDDATPPRLILPDAYSPAVQR